MPTSEALEVDRPQEDDVADPLSVEAQAVPGRLKFLATFKEISQLPATSAPTRAGMRL